MTNLEQTKTHPIELMRSEYISRRKANPRYTLSAFARDLGLSVSFLSRLMRGERSLTVNQTIQIGTILGLNSKAVDQMIESLVENAEPNSKISKKFISALNKKNRTDSAELASVSFFEVERFKAIAEWYHMAILNLTLTKNFSSSSSDIAKRLMITRIEAEDALRRLTTLGLIQKKDGVYKKTHSSLYIKTLKSERAIREFTKQTMQKAANVLDDPSDEAFQKRCMPGTTLPIDTRMLPELKKLILKFQLDFASQAKSTEYDEVYHFNLQLFPLTQTLTKTKEDPKS